DGGNADLSDSLSDDCSGDGSRGTALRDYRNDRRCGAMMDFSVISRNLDFLLLQGLLGIGNFIGGTFRLAIPAIALGFVLGVLVGIARLARSPWIRLPATAYVEFFRGVPLVMVIFWFW